MGTFESTDNETKLRLVGESDWASRSITCFFDVDGLTSSREVLVDGLANHVTVLCEHLFLSTKPPRPTQSRWTGVPGVCQWCLGLELFHQTLAPLLQALSDKKDSGSGDGDAATATMTTLDNDAGTSRLKPPPLNYSSMLMTHDSLILTRTAFFD